MDLGEYEFMDGSTFNGNYENNKKSGAGDAAYMVKKPTDDGGKLTEP